MFHKCNICFNNIYYNPYKPKCRCNNIYYHHDCIKKWYNQKQIYSCPICRDEDITYNKYKKNLRELKYINYICNIFYIFATLLFNLNIININIIIGISIFKVYYYTKLIYYN